MSGWSDLDNALNAVLHRGECVRFWWRDDDAGRDDPKLARLLELATQHNAPIALAVVPAWLDADSQGRIAANGLASIFQHGYQHANHAPRGARSIELGGRPEEPILDELKTGYAILKDAFGAAFIAVLVPPWNRIDAALAGHLGAVGFYGLSTFGRRQAAEAAKGVTQINTHLDPIDWRGTRLFVGEQAALGQLIEALAADEPIGLLSHHLDMDEAGWSFFDQLLTVLRHHPAAQICAPSQLLPDGVSPLSVHP